MTTRSIVFRPGLFSFKFDRRVPFVAGALLIFTLIVLVLSISYGEYKITPLEVIQTLTGTLDPSHPDYRNFNLVVHSFRLPRILTAFLVGIALAASGTMMQGLTRNPLSEPGILGVSAGAGLAAVSLIVWFKDVPISLLPWAAFGGGLITAAVIYLLAWKDGGTVPVRLILIGVAIAAVLGSATSFLLVFGSIREVQQAYIWLTGSVYGRGWEHVRMLGSWLLVFMPLTFLMVRPLNALSLGDDVAQGLGLRVEVQRAVILMISVALAAAAVAAAGTIGFVGLVAPHISRRLVGPSHEGLLPVAALFGGALLVLSDLVSRAVIAPSELPIGVITAILGAPYFMYLLTRK